MRSFIRTPGIALALVFTIALGVGSNASVHGFVRGLTGPAALHLPADSVVSVFARDARGEKGPVSYDEFVSAKDRARVFEWLGAARISQGAIKLAGQSAILPVAAVTSDLARLLGLPLGEGVVISHRLWRSELGAKANVHGEQIQIDGIDARVSGVAPDWLEGIYRDRPIDVWMSVHDEVLKDASQGSRNLWVLGRLLPGITVGQAQTLLQEAGGAAELNVLPYTGLTPEMAAGFSRIGTLLNFAAVAVFFIACANVILFLLGRAFARSHQTAIRVALGASRGQIARELLSDSIVISVVGGISGILLAVWTSRVLPALLYESDAERLVFAPDLFSIVAASATCIGITMACGLLPVLLLPQDRAVTVLKLESLGPSRTIRRVRLSLVVAQMASCCTLVISTALLLDGLRTALATSAGRRLDRTILASVQADPNVGIRYFRDVEQTAKPIAVDSKIEWAGRLPGSQPIWQSFHIEPAHLPLREVTLDIAWLTADSLMLFAPRPTAGRMFGAAEQTCRAAIVNETAAEELFGQYTAGRTIRDSANRPVEIIGVLATQKPERGVEQNRPTIYYDHTNHKGAPPDRITHARFRAPIASELARAELDVNVVSPGYFEAVGIKLIAGNLFDDHGSFGNCRIGIVNQEASELYFGGNAIGAAVIDDRGRRTEIIGVVHSELLGTFQLRPEPGIYLPMWQDVLPRMTMIVHAGDVSESRLTDFRRRIEAVPGHGPFPPLVKTLEEHLTQTSLAPLRVATTILGASAAIGLLLSVLGLYGALSDAARQRRRELALRIALGAQRWRVISQVLGEGGRLACAGTLAGTLGSLLSLRWMTGITGVAGSPDLRVWLAAPLVLAGAVAVAGILPARRALMVNPIMVMREE